MRYPTAVLIAIGVLLFFSVIQFHTERTTFFAILGASAAAFAIHQAGIAVDIRAQRRTVEKVQRVKEEKSELLGKMDELLEKISRSGMDSLSPEEKSTLERASKLMADNKEGSRD